MTLFDTAQTIKGWIRSCTKSDQLDLCEDVVKEYVVKRFTGQVDLIELAESEADLRMTIKDRRVILAAYPYPSGTETRTDNHLNEIL